MAPLDEAAREWSKGTLDLPEDVDDTLTERIDELLEHDRWRYDQDWWVIVLSVVHWALESEYESYADKRKHGQENAVEVFDEELSDVQNRCGRQLFEEEEFKIEDKHIARKWQAMFEQLLRILDEDHPG